MKQELNLQLDAHMNLLQNIAFQAISGIKVKEVSELRNICKKDKDKYFNHIKLRYIVFLGGLGLNYKISQDIERVLFNYINYLIHELPVENKDSNAQFNISVS
jgi:hypothetical protein